MLSVCARLLLAALLLVAAGLKLADGPSARAALGTYGLQGERTRALVWLGLIVVETALAAGVAGGLDSAAYATAGLLAVFAAAQALALAEGRAGAPCACLGARGRVSRGSLARTSLLAVAFALLPLLPGGDPTTDEWLALGLGVALAAVAGLALVVLALAREVGVLRLRLGPQSALEIPEEGPPIGGPSPLAERFPAELAGDGVALAVFTSDGCGLCRALEPAIAALGRDPLVSVRIFDEVRDASMWAAASVPGSPFAVALDDEGRVLAKGTFNSGGQLESVIAAALVRRRATAHA